MRHTTTHPPRILLCASAAHCAQVLHAAAAARVDMHGLLPSTTWPAHPAPGQQLLWALTPTEHPHTPTTQAIEQQWRTHIQQGGHGFTIHMLYGSAAQQAAQLAPRMSLQHTRAADEDNTHADCRECLDASSEQALFQNLLQRETS